MSLNNNIETIWVFYIFELTINLCDTNIQNTLCGLLKYIYHITYLLILIRNIINIIIY